MLASAALGSGQREQTLEPLRKGAAGGNRLRGSWVCGRVRMIGGKIAMSIEASTE